jgi:hypothetical protein
MAKTMTMRTMKTMVIVSINRKNDADDVSAVGSKRKRKSMRISNASYRKRRRHASPSQKNVTDSSENSAACIRTVRHLYAAIVDHHFVLNFVC